jgi:hypothetical protein
MPDIFEGKFTHGLADDVHLMGKICAGLTDT